MNPNAQLEHLFIYHHVSTQSSALRLLGVHSHLPCFPCRPPCMSMCVGLSAASRWPVSLRSMWWTQGGEPNVVDSLPWLVRGFVHVCTPGSHQSGLDRRHMSAKMCQVPPHRRYWDPHGPSKPTPMVGLRNPVVSF